MAARYANVSETAVLLNECVFCKNAVARQKHLLLACFHVVCYECTLDAVQCVTPNWASLSSSGQPFAACTNTSNKSAQLQNVIRCRDCFDWTSISRGGNVILSDLPVPTEIGCVQPTPAAYQPCGVWLPAGQLGVPAEVDVFCTGSAGMCDECGMDVEQCTAVVACRDCCIVLCHDHRVAHEKSRRTRHHQLESLLLGQSNGHREGNRLPWQCTRQDSCVCDDTLVQDGCSETDGDDSGCEEEIDNAESVIQETECSWKTDLSNNLRQLINTATESLSHIAQCKTDIDQKAEDVSAVIANAFDDIRQVLQRHEQKVYRQVDDLRWELQKDLSKQEIAIEKQRSVQQRALAMLHNFYDVNTVPGLGGLFMQPSLLSSRQHRIPPADMYTCRFEWTRYEIVVEAIETFGTLLEGCHDYGERSAVYFWNVCSLDIESFVNLSSPPLVHGGRHVTKQIQCLPSLSVANPCVLLTGDLQSSATANMTCVFQDGKRSVSTVAMDNMAVHVKHFLPDHEYEIRGRSRLKGYFPVYRVIPAGYPFYFTPQAFYQRCAPGSHGRAIVSTAQTGDREHCAMAVLPVLPGVKECRFMVTCPHEVDVFAGITSWNVGQASHQSRDGWELKDLFSQDGVYFDHQCDYQVFQGYLEKSEKRVRWTFGTVVDLKITHDTFSGIWQLHVKMYHQYNLSDCIHEAVFLIGSDTNRLCFGFFGKLTPNKPALVLLPSY